MYKQHYPQRFCMTSIYSYGEYNIFNIIVLVMSNNIRRMRVWLDRFFSIRFKPRYFFRNILRLRLIRFRELLCFHSGVPC